MKPIKPDDAEYATGVIGQTGGTPATFFQDVDVRNKFIGKVYSILCIQLLFTCGVSTLFILSKDIQMFLRQNPYILFFAMAASMPIFCAIACCKGARRKFPINYILLSLLTICESIILGVISVIVSTETLLTSYFLTAFLFGSMTLVAKSGIIDMTRYWLVLFVGSLVLSVGWLVAYGILAFTNKDVHTFRMILAYIGVFVCLAYIIFDTQMILGGNAYELSEEDYIYAVMVLYLDILNLLFHLIAILENRES